MSIFESCPIGTGMLLGMLFVILAEAIGEAVRKIKGGKHE